MKAKDLAKIIIKNYTKLSPDGITPLKIQKLLYYIYVWGIVTNNKVIEDNFVKWVYGPANAETYYEYQHLGSNPIPVPQDISIDLDEQSKKFIEFIIFSYINYSALTLSSMTHQDDPWIKTQQNEQISEIDIKKFYSNLNFAKNFPLEENKEYYPIETDLHYSFLFDFADELSSQPVNYKSFNDFIKLSESSHESLNKHYEEWFGD
ncbi:MAG: DUF4065 domain-containing protein [Melioribacteraceae bacterium]|nr:DUF4065 domain-containing protein [Melioribacteraceae bacterium]MCF8395866.1 DUF4065 domain-containing protein [Melioribacteraceae bacterium]MCF8420040.1 DUF4065 domain-containing protein [Melioribacteraceae bacterium]